MIFSKFNQNKATIRPRGIVSRSQYTIQINPPNSNSTSKMSGSQQSTIGSSSSRSRQMNSISLQKQRSERARRSLSVVSLEETQKHVIPAKALQITDLVAKKKRALVIKYSVKDSYEPVPNILQIKQSVQKEEISFMRRMDKVLNKCNAYLLPNLKQDLHIENHNYLREISQKAKKNRRYLL